MNWYVFLADGEIYVAGCFDYEVKDYHGVVVSEYYPEEIDALNRAVLIAAKGGVKLSEDTIKRLPNGYRG